MTRASLKVKPIPIPIEPEPTEIGDRIIKLCVTGSPVSQKNSKDIAWRGSDRYGRARAVLLDKPRVKKWRNEAVRQLRNQWQRRPKIEGPIAVVIVAWLRTKQRIDTDNLAAAPLDAMQAAEVIRNDYQVDEVVVLRRRDNDNPRVEIAIFDPDRLQVTVKGIDDE